MRTDAFSFSGVYQVRADVSESQAMKNAFDYTKISWVEFGWICEQCKALNHTTFSHWVQYDRLDVCKACEKAYLVKAPFD